MALSIQEGIGSQGFAQPLSLSAGGTPEWFATEGILVVGTLFPAPIHSSQQLLTVEISYLIRMPRFPLFYVEDAFSVRA